MIPETKIYFEVCKKIEDLLYDNLGNDHHITVGYSRVDQNKVHPIPESYKQRMYVCVNVPEDGPQDLNIPESLDGILIYRQTLNSGQFAEK